MELIYTSDEIKEMDQQAVQKGKTILSLVEKAGEALATRIEALPEKGTIWILCGAGNNGADGLSAALLLARTRTVKLIFLQKDAVNSDRKSVV